jgi:prevent-host-death family protein
MPANVITHRELRNESGRILREVQEGQTFIITNNGEPVAAIQPIQSNPLAGLRHEQAKQGARFADVAPEEGNSTESALEALLFLRGER